MPDCCTNPRPVRVPELAVRCLLADTSDLSAVWGTCLTVPSCGACLRCLLAMPACGACLQCMLTVVPVYGGGLPTIPACGACLRWCLPTVVPVRTCPHLLAVPVCRISCCTCSLLTCGTCLCACLWCSPACVCLQYLLVSACVCLRYRCTCTYLRSLLVVIACRNRVCLCCLPMVPRCCPCLAQIHACRACHVFLPCPFACFTCLLSVYLHSLSLLARYACLQCIFLSLHCFEEPASCSAWL